MTDRSTTAPNGATYAEFEALITDLQHEGRGAHGMFMLIEASGNDLDGVSMDLICLDDKGREFHGYYETATYTTEPGVMTAEFVLKEFWNSCLEAAWMEHDGMQG